MTDGHGRDDRSDAADDAADPTSGGTDEPEERADDPHTGTGDDRTGAHSHTDDTTDDSGRVDFETVSGDDAERDAADGHDGGDDPGDSDPASSFFDPVGEEEIDTPAGATSHGATDDPAGDTAADERDDGGEDVGTDTGGGTADTDDPHIGAFAEDTSGDSDSTESDVSDDTPIEIDIDDDEGGDEDAGEVETPDDEGGESFGDLVDDAAGMGDMADTFDDEGETAAEDETGGDETPLAAQIRALEGDDDSQGVAEQLVYAPLEDWEAPLQELRATTTAYHEHLPFGGDAEFIRGDEEAREELIGFLYDGIDPDRMDMSRVVEGRDSITGILTEYIDDTLPAGEEDDLQYISALGEIDSTLAAVPHRDAILQHAEDGTSYTDLLDQTLAAAVDGVRKTLFAARYWNKQEERIENDMVEELEDLDSFTSDGSFARRNREELYEIAHTGREIARDATDAITQLLGMAESWKEAFDTYGLEQAASEYSLDTLDRVSEAYEEAFAAAEDRADALERFTTFAELPNSAPETEYGPLPELEEGALYMTEVADSIVSDMGGYEEGPHEGSYSRHSVGDSLPATNTTIKDLSSLAGRARELSDEFVEV